MKLLKLVPFVAMAFGLVVNPCHAQAKKPTKVGLETKTVLVPVQLITRDNVQDYKGWTK